MMLVMKIRVVRKKIALHAEHLEDEILNYGVDGGRAALNFLRSLRDML
jgi:hypothetical protein